MSEQSPENVRFLISEDSACPYLPNLRERKIFTPLLGKGSEVLFENLNRYGFRRSHNVLYRPICENCSMCKPVRTITKQFKPSNSQRRIIKRNRDIKTISQPPIASIEQYNLFKRYLNNRHDDGNMSAMGFDDYRLMVDESPVQSEIIEYRLANKNSANSKLLAVALCDILFDGISMVYSFFDPDYQLRSLGKFMILDQINRVKEAKLKYLYLGYWVSGSKKMNYKIEFKPLEYVKENNGWHPLILNESNNLIQANNISH